MSVVYECMLWLLLEKREMSHVRNLGKKKSIKDWLLTLYFLHESGYEFT